MLMYDTGLTLEFNIKSKLQTSSLVYIQVITVSVLITIKKISSTALPKGYWEPRHHQYKHEKASSIMMWWSEWIWIVCHEFCFYFLVSAMVSAIRQGAHAPRATSRICLLITLLRTWTASRSKSSFQTSFQMETWNVWSVFCLFCVSVNLLTVTQRTPVAFKSTVCCVVPATPSD